MDLDSKKTDNNGGGDDESGGFFDCNICLEMVLFMISIEPAPMLEDKEKWFVRFSCFDIFSSDFNFVFVFAFFVFIYIFNNVSCFKSLVFRDFIAKCLTKDPRITPTASELLKTLGAKMNDEYGDTGPSKPQVPNGLEVLLRMAHGCTIAL
uniref:Uncharacterized protein n=1 Tax=Lactuca sativa TaxID=4236 RepID=A0A9R1W099_LACSA|nr:hypothetical protein LSAT_V11C300151120 [Lactuca sativa]